MWRFAVLMAVAAVGGFAGAQTTGQAAPPRSTILVFPFETPEEGDWIGRAAQEDLATELTRGTVAKVKSPFELKPPGDVYAAVKRGHEYHADYVLIGHAQSVEGIVRLTGQVVDVAAGHAVGMVKITGPRTSLFDLEASLSRQVYSALPTAILKPDVIASLGEPPPPSSFIEREPEPMPPFQIFAIDDYAIPQRYEFAPIFVPVPVPYDPVIAYSGFGAFGQPYSYTGFPYNDFGAFYDGYGSAWYPAYNYPFGWLPYGALTVVNNNFGHNHGFRHHNGGFGWASATPHGLRNSGPPNGWGNPVAIEFGFGGNSGEFGGLAPRGFAPGIPAGGFAVGFSGVSSGFSTFRGPRLGTVSGPRGLSGGGFGGFGGGLRGGTMVSR